MAQPGSAGAWHFRFTVRPSLSEPSAGALLLSSSLRIVIALALALAIAVVGRVRTQRLCNGLSYESYRPFVLYLNGSL